MKLCDAIDNEYIDAGLRGGWVRDERRSTRRQEYLLPGPLLAALTRPQVDELVKLLQAIAAMPGTEVTGADRDDPRKAPGWIRIVALPRPVPRITDAPLPTYRPGPSYFDERQDRITAAALFGYRVWPNRGGKSSLFTGGSVL